MSDLFPGSLLVALTSKVRLISENSSSDRRAGVPKFPLPAAGR